MNRTSTQRVKGSNVPSHSAATDEYRGWSIRSASAPFGSNSDRIQREEVQVEMECREETIGVFRRRGRLLLLSNERRLLVPHQGLLTGCTLRHPMTLPCVLLLMRLKMRLVIDAFATHVAGKARDLQVNRLDMRLQILRPCCVEVAAVIRARYASPFVNRLSMI